MAQRIRYVNTASSGGDGTTNGTSGSTAAYSNLYDAANSEAADLVSAGDYLTIYCEGSTADTSEPDFSGFTTDSTHYVELIVDQSVRHDGKWDTGAYRLVNTGYDGALKINTKSVRAYGLQVENQKTGAGGGAGGSGIWINGGANGGYYIIDSCVCRYTGDYTNQNAYGVDPGGLFDYTGHTLIIANSVFYDFRRGIYLRTPDTSVYAAYNNTIHSSTEEGINHSYSPSGANLRLYNNLVQSSTVKDYENNGSSGGTFNHATNISEDTTSPDGSFQSLAATFVNEGSDDFHLDSSDTVAKDAGTDLSADAYYPFSLDIDGDTRSGTWDIGADEISGGAPAATVKQLAAMGVG